MILLLYGRGIEIQRWQVIGKVMVFTTPQILFWGVTKPGSSPSKAGCIAKQAPYLLTIALPPNPCKYYSNETGDITQR